MDGSKKKRQEKVGHTEEFQVKKKNEQGEQRKDFILVKKK